MVLTFTRKDALRSGLIGIGVAVALAVPSFAVADDPPVVTQAPNITGTPQVGQTLHAVDGKWTGSQDAAENYAWLRCTDQDFEDCITIPGATGDTYTLTDEDAGDMMRVTLLVSLGDDSDHKTSDLTDVVKTASGSTPAADEPVDAELHDLRAHEAERRRPGGRQADQAAAGREGLRQGLVTGAKLTTFTVKSPKGVTVKVACKGASARPSRSR